MKERDGMEQENVGTGKGRGRIRREREDGGIEERRGMTGSEEEEGSNPPSEIPGSATACYCSLLPTPGK